MRIFGLFFLTLNLKTIINEFVVNPVKTREIYTFQGGYITMNKSELVAAIASKADISKKDAEAAVKAFTETVTKELKKGDRKSVV